MIQIELQTVFTAYVVHCMCRSLGFMLKAVCAALPPVNLATVQSFAPVGNSKAHEGCSILKCSFIVTLFRKAECRSYALNSYTHMLYIHGRAASVQYPDIGASASAVLGPPRKYIKTHQKYRGIWFYTVQPTHNRERISQAVYYSIDLTALLVLSPCFSTQYSQLQQHSHIPLLHTLALTGQGGIHTSIKILQITHADKPNIHYIGVTTY